MPVVLISSSLFLRIKKSIKKFTEFQLKIITEFYLNCILQSSKMEAIMRRYTVCKFAPM